MELECNACLENFEVSSRSKGGKEIICPHCGRLLILRVEYTLQAVE